MNFICLVTIFTLISSIVCDNFVVSLDITTKTPAPRVETNPIPAMDYHEIASKVKQVAINIDKFVDILVDIIRMGGEGIDPIHLPDVTETFNDKILFFYVDGQFLMRNGRLHNLKSISRHGNATLHYDKFKLFINTAFSFDRLDFDYDFISKIVSIGPQGNMNGNAQQLIYEAVFVYDIFENKLSLNKTSLTDANPVDVQVHVSVVIDWLANPIINWLSDLYENKILLEIQIAVEKIIRDHLPHTELLFANNS